MFKALGWYDDILCHGVEQKWQRDECVQTVTILSFTVALEHAQLAPGEAKPSY